jgi:hypothetical protein
MTTSNIKKRPSATLPHARHIVYIFLKGEIYTTKIRASTYDGDAYFFFFFFHFRKSMTLVSKSCNFLPELSVEGSVSVIYGDDRRPIGGDMKV